MIELFNNINKSLSIGILGDFIVDQYYFVEANKISPEFPIPIMKSCSSQPDKTYPGGAGNVCRQLCEFDIQVKYFGLLNSNFSFLINDKVEFKGVYSDSIQNPIKKRYYQNDFPLCRLDIECENYSLELKDLSYFQNKICESLGNYKFNSFIFSDYSKGIFNNIDLGDYIKNVNARVKIVDPKNGPISKWKGCNVIKPNSKEAQSLTNKKNWKDQAKFIIDETGCECVVITQEGDGFVGIINNQHIEFRPSVKTKAESVIGAGDCFISLFALFSSCGINYEKCAEMAFAASSKYVRSKYCNPISILDLLENKFISNPSILSNRNFILGFTNGCFDIIHDGHIECLKFAKSKCDKLVVALNSDSSVAKLAKNHNLVNSLSSRIKILESMEFVDYIVVFEEETPYEIISKIKPDVLIKSDQYKEPVGFDLVKKLEIFPNLEGFSTSNIIEKIKKSIA